jgi:hypothetical protein
VDAATCSSTTSEETKYNTWCKKSNKTIIWATPATRQVFGDVMLCPFVNSYWHFQGMLRQAATAWPWRCRRCAPLEYGNYSSIDMGFTYHKSWFFNFNIVHTVHDTKFSLSNQPYTHWNVNMIHNLLHVLTLLKCHHFDCNHKGVPWWGTQKVLKHVRDCISTVFIFQCM